MEKVGPRFGSKFPMAPLCCISKKMCVLKYLRTCCVLRVLDLHHKYVCICVCVHVVRVCVPLSLKVKTSIGNAPNFKK